VAQNERMVAINSALAVDLTGQVCADSLGTTIYSGFGGQLDFIRGAARAKGGKPIIALSSTAKDGAVSRIVDTLLPGSVWSPRAPTCTTSSPSTRGELVRQEPARARRGTHRDRPSRLPRRAAGAARRRKLLEAPTAAVPME